MRKRLCTWYRESRLKHLTATLTATGNKLYEKAAYLLQKITENQGFIDGVETVDILE